MGKILCLILSLCFWTGSLYAGTPFIPEVNKRFKTLEASVGVLQALPSAVAPTANGVGNMRVARVTFDSTTMGTSSATAYSLGVSLPAKSLLWDGVIYVTSGFTGGSVALECEDAGNIKGATAAATYGATGSKLAIIPVGTAASAVNSIAASCVISAKVTGSDVVGKFNAWIEYFVTD